MLVYVSFAYKYNDEIYFISKLCMGFVRELPAIRGSGAAVASPGFEVGTP